MANNHFYLLKLKIEEWLSEVSKTDPHLLQLKKDLEKLAFILPVAGLLVALLPVLIFPSLEGLFSEFFRALAISICLFVTYLNWKYK